MGFNFPLIEENRSSPLSSEYQTPIPPPTTEYSTIKHMSQIKSIISFYSSAFYGNKNVFMPRWKPEYSFTDPEYFTPYKWTYLFDHSPLIKALE